MEWNEQKSQVNISQAETDDLLDRITAFRAGMEPDAIALIEKELRRRGVTAAEIAAHREQEYLVHPDGSAKVCSFCRKPAVREGWGWHKHFGKLPVFPRRMRYCKEHDAGN